MSTLTERLQIYMDYKGLNYNQVTVQAGLSVGQIGKAIKTNKGLHSDSIEKILNTYRDLNSEWLLIGSGDMLKRENKGDTFMNPLNEPQVNHSVKMPGNNFASMSQTNIFSDIPYDVEKQIENLKEQFDVNDAKLLYHLSINDLNRKVVVMKDRLKKTYNSYFVLKKIVDGLKQSPKTLKTPSNWDVFVNIQEPKLKKVLDTTEDKKLKAIYLYLHLERGLDIMLTATRIAIQFLDIHTKYENFNKELGI